jgi:hypothetical protein
MLHCNPSLSILTMHGLNINSVISTMGIYASTAKWYFPVSALKKSSNFSTGRMCITTQPVRHCRNTYMSIKYYDCSSHSLPLYDLTCRNGLYLLLMKYLCFWDYAISLKKVLHKCWPRRKLFYSPICGYMVHKNQPSSFLSMFHFSDNEQ